MKNIYTILLASTALLLASGAKAQSNVGTKLNPARTTNVLVSPIERPHGTHANAMRGTAPPNDECGSITAEALVAGGSLSLSGTTTGATNTGDAVSGSSLDLGGDTSFVFHQFTTTECLDLAIAYCGTTTIPAIYQAVLSLTCPLDADLINFSSGEFTTCTDGNATIYWTSVPAGTYYLPVRGEPATAGPYTITISATACPVAPANDDCDAAISLTANTFCNFEYFTGVGGTESLPGLTCNNFTGDAGDDVWFSFVATAADMSIGVQGSDDGDGDVNTGYDAVVELFEGACPGTSINCADASLGCELEEIAATGLSVGATYYVRVYDWYAAPWPDHTFGICVVEGVGGNIGIEESSAVDAWSIFPNPGTGVFNVQYTGASALSNIEVFDLTGRVVYNEQVSLAKGANHNIDLSGLGAGNYNVRFTAHGVRTEQRLMVK